MEVPVGGMGPQAAAGELGHIPTKVSTQYADYRREGAASAEDSTSVPGQESTKQGGKDEETQ
jgi:hypothetical protein